MRPLSNSGPANVTKCYKRWANPVDAGGFAQAALHFEAYLFAGIAFGLRRGRAIDDITTVGDGDFAPSLKPG